MMLCTLGSDAKELDSRRVQVSVRSRQELYQDDLEPIASRCRKCIEHLEVE